MDDGPRDERRSATGASPRLTGKVIKSDSGESAGDKPLVAGRRAGVLNAEEFEARSTAKQIILDAQKRAEEIKGEAHRFKEDVFAKARAEAKGDVQARAAEELARAKLQAGQIVADAEKDVVALALKVAEKIIGRDLERDPQVLLEIIATTIQSSRASKAMVLRVHPEDGRVLREKKPKLFELIGRSTDLVIRDDSDVERGGCMIQTEFGVIDGQIRTQFEMLMNVLLPDTARKEQK